MAAAPIHQNGLPCPGAISVAQLGTFTQENGSWVVIRGDGMHDYALGDIMRDILKKGYELGKEGQKAQEQVTITKLESENARLLKETERLQSLLSPPAPAQTVVEEHSIKDLQFDLSALTPDNIFGFYLSHSLGDKLLEYIIENPTQAFPFFERLFFLDPEKISALFKTSLKGKNEVIRQALKTVLKEERKHVVSSFAALKQLLPGKEWKSLRGEMGRAIRERCPTVKSCVEAGLPELANEYVSAGIRTHVPGQENDALIGDLSFLLFFDSTLKLACDRVQELFKKDPALLRKCAPLLEQLTGRIYREWNEHFDEWCLFFIELNIRTSTDFFIEMSKMLMQEQFKRPVSLRFITPGIMRHWAIDCGEDGKRAFWLAVGNLGLRHHDVFKLILSLAHAMETPPPREKSEENRKRQAHSACFFLDVWERAPADWNVPPLGPLMIPLWELLAEELAPEVRLFSLSALATGIQRDNQLEQITDFVTLFLREIECNTSFKDEWKEQYFRVCYQMLYQCQQKTDHPVANSKIAALTWKLWEKTASRPAVEYLYYTDSEIATYTHSLLVDLTQEWRNTEQTDQLELFFDKATLVAAYQKIVEKFIKIYKDKLPENFSKLCIEGLIKKMDGSMGVNFMAKACAMGGAILAERLLTVWKRPLEVWQFQEITRTGSIRPAQEPNFPDNPYINQERSRLQNIILGAALDGNGRVWEYFISNLATLGFDSLHRAKEAGTSVEDLKLLATSQHRAACD